MRSALNGCLIPNRLLVHSPSIYSQTLFPLWHSHTNAKPKFITAMDHCFNARHLSSNSCPLLKRLQPLHQSLCNVWSPPRQIWGNSGGLAFKISALAADPKVHEHTSSDAKLRLGVVRAVVNFAGAENCPFLNGIFCAAKNFWIGRRDHKQWPRLYGVLWKGANVFFNRSRNAPAEFARWNLGFSIDTAL